MLIEGVRLFSYGPFEDSGEINFAAGMNLLVGQNNSGKSAILKSFRNDSLKWPHRNLERFRDIDLEGSSQWLKIQVSGAEIRDAFMMRGGEFHFPVDRNINDADPAPFAAEYFSKDRSYTFECMRQETSFSKVHSGPSHGGFSGDAVWSAQLRCQRPNFVIAGFHNSSADTLLGLMPNLWAQGIFRFDAERMSIARSGQEENPSLLANAANLPAVLQRMRGRQPGLFAKLESRLREILPSVHGVTTTHVGANEVEIVVWPTSHMDHPEHGFSLNESGTGIAQVLAILTAVMTRENSVIIIDEINSFLHPAAVKALLRILMTEFPSHQYILSTHSAEVISSSNPASLTVVKRHGFDSTCRAVSSGDVNELRDLSDLLGISIGDIFAADRVLWVEGRTEELCLPFLMNHWELEIPRGLIISPVVATGDFSGKRDFELVLSIYSRLSQVTLPLVRTVTFSFDAEDLSEGERADLNKRARGRVLFLPRRHLECYLIDPSAVARFINARDSEQQTVEPKQVEHELSKRGGLAKYRAKAQWAGSITDDKWLVEVDGANLISDTIEALTDSRVTFKKTTDSLELLETVVETNPQSLSDLREYLRKLLKLVASDEKSRA